MKMKRVADAFIKTVFVAGCIHLAILTWASIARGSYEELNFFNFLDLQVIFPESTKGLEMFVVSQGVFLGMFLVVYSVLNRKNK
ncbi:hypothetical protein HY947_05770 [Candidatus Gottesmanbacteria bacterium]|nr:hypothetical protein [Candidatus Gottesmanbacteria bacterium]